jgi:uncharacterized membrane protein
MMSEQTMSTTGSLRERALRRLKKQRDFRIHLVVYLMVNTMLVAVWAMSGAGFFWPIFPILGWGVGVVANAWDAYGRDEPTEEQIEREMAHLRDGR